MFESGRNLRSGSRHRQSGTQLPGGKHYLLVSLEQICPPKSMKFNGTVVTTKMSPK